MKKSLVARGIIGAVASLLGVAAVGCGADGFDEGAAGEGEIRSTSQALTVTGNADADIQFFGSVKLDSSILNADSHADALELIAGGIKLDGSLSTKIAVYDSENDTLTQLRNAANDADIVLPAGLAEPVIAQIPGETLAYLITGGRTVKDGAVSATSYVLKLALNGSSQIASAALHTVAGPSGTVLPSGRVFSHKSIKQCGSAANKKLIAFGGTTSSSGWQSMSSLSSTSDIMVFTYDATTPANSDWNALKDTVTPTANTVKLRTTRGYPEVFDVDATNHDEFFIGGGLGTGVNARSTVDRIVVNSSCVATNAVEPESGVALAEEAAPMPDARARFTSAPVTSTVNNFPSAGINTTFDFIAYGGNNATISDGTAFPTALFQFDPDGTTSGKKGIWRSTCTLEARVFPRSIVYSSSLVKIVSGIKPKSGTQSTDPWNQTSKVVETFNSGTCGADDDMTDDRVGVFADLLNEGDGTFSGYVGLGAKYTNKTGAPYVQPTSMPSTVLVVP